MNLNTSYLGFQLPHPLIAGASPMVDDLDTVKRLEDAGVAAIVMHSLFEEQITREQEGTILDMELHNANSAEALSYFPAPGEFRLGPENYLEQLRRIKEAVTVPVIASLNGTSSSGWLGYAKLLEQAGADALELNVYYMATSPQETAAQVEARTLDVLKNVKSAVKIPVAVKLSTFHTALPHLAQELVDAGADGLVLFNRFLQPDIDLEHLAAEATLRLSNPVELLVRLRWLAILHGQVKVPLAASGGVHSAMDAMKSVAAGASAVQMVSALLIHGPEHLNSVREEMIHWMEEHEYESLQQMLGSMSLNKCPNPLAFTRANYMRMLQGWRG
jgi:dihydroorotate dehydrogenase (fumarate)